MATSPAPRVRRGGGGGSQPATHPPAAHKGYGGDRYDSAYSDSSGGAHSGPGDTARAVDEHGADKSIPGGGGGGNASSSEAAAAAVSAAISATVTPPATAHLHYGGSRKGRAANVERDHEGRAARLFRDFFAASPTHGPVAFRRKFRMRRAAFLRIARGVLDVDAAFFSLKRNALQQPGLSTFQKVVLALRILFRGRTADACDEYVQVGDSTSALGLSQFCAAVVARFGAAYLHAPGVSGVERVLDEKAERRNPRQCFAAIQSACAADVVRGFALLQTRFAIVRNPPRAWSRGKLRDIMAACVILHNLIVEDERQAEADGDDDAGSLLENLDFEGADEGGGGGNGGEHKQRDVLLPPLPEPSARKRR